MLCLICKDAELEFAQENEVRKVMLCRRCTNYFIFDVFVDDGQRVANTTNYLVIPVREVGDGKLPPENKEAQVH